ncbi:MAG: hypothetical protein V4558_05220 [Gemmatimonadota bacterium]
MARLAGVWALILAASAAGQGGRKVIELQLKYSDARWVVGGDSSGPLVNPNRIMASGSLVLITDPGAPGVVALDSRTGKELWRYGKKGRGPGEMIQPVLASWHPDGTVIVDNGTRRLYFIATSGKLLEERSIPNGLFIAGICSLRTGEVIVHYPDPVGSGLGVIRSKSRALPKVAYPFAIGGPSMTDRALDLTSLPSAGSPKCVAARKTANGLAVFSPTGTPKQVKYIEALEQRKYRPAMEAKDTSDLPIPFALDVSADAGKIYVYFGGSTSCSFLCVDVYDAADLRYLQTYRLRGKLGVRPMDVIVANGELVILGMRDDLPIVLSFGMPAEGSRR